MQLASMGLPSGPHDSRLRDYIQYLQDQTPSADLHTMLGIAYLAQGDVCRAFAALRSAISLDGSHFFAHLKYADLLHRLCSFQAALAVSKQALLLARGPSEWRMVREQMRRIDEARQLSAAKTFAHGRAPEWTFVVALFIFSAVFALR